MAALSKEHSYTFKNVNLPCNVLHPWTSSCALNAITFFYHSLKGSSKFFLILYLIPLLINRKISSELLLQEAINFVHSSVFGAGCAVVTTTFICILRWLVGRFYIINFGLIPGFIGGASIFIEVPSRREANTTLMLAFVTNLYLKVLHQKELISLPPSIHLLMFSVCSSCLLYCLRSIPGSYSLMWPLVPKRVPSDPVAQKHCRHEGRCLDSIKQTAVSYLFYGFVIQGLKIIIFNFKLLLTKHSLILQTFFNRNNARFPLFLSLYFSLFKGVSCLLVNLRGKDEAWQALLAGGVASLTYLIHPNLTLTCLAFSNLAQILCRKYKKNSKGLPWTELTFMILVGMLFHARTAYPSACPKSLFTMMDTISFGRSNVVYSLAEENLITRW